MCECIDNYLDIKYEPEYPIGGDWDDWDRLYVRAGYEDDDKVIKCTIR